MNSILKKTLIAAAVAGTFGANAATISSVDNSSTVTGVQQVISSEGLAVAGGDITTGNDPSSANTNQLRVTFTPEVAHQADDAVVFTFTGATLDSTTTISSVSLVTAAGTAVSGVSVIGVDRTAGTVTLSLGTGASLAAGTSYYLNGVTLTSLGTSVSVSTSSQRGQIAFDPATSTEIAQVASQWTLGATADTDLNGVIDVTNSRYTFSSNSDGDSSLDEFDITVTTSSNLMTATATSVSHVVTTTGNFDWTLNSSSAFNTATVDNTVANGSATASESLNTDGDELTLLLTGDADNGVSTWQFDVPGDVELVESTYSAASTVNYSFQLSGHPATAGSLALGSSSIGGWTLGGTTAFIEFYPTGTGITQFVYIANTSSVDAGVEMSVLDSSGTEYECGELDTVAKGNAVTKFGPEVFSTLEECGVVGDRLAITLTINAAASAIDVTAGYNSRGDRVLID